MPKLKMGWSPCCHSSPCTLLLATLRGLRIGTWVLRFAHTQRVHCGYLCTMRLHFLAASAATAAGQLMGRLV